MMDLIDSDSKAIPAPAPKDYYHGVLTSNGFQAPIEPRRPSSAISSAFHRMILGHGDAAEEARRPSNNGASSFIDTSPFEEGRPFIKAHYINPDYSREQFQRKKTLSKGKAPEAENLSPFGRMMRG